MTRMSLEQKGNKLGKRKRISRTHDGMKFYILNVRSRFVQFSSLLCFTRLFAATTRVEIKTNFICPRHLNFIRVKKTPKDIEIGQGSKLSGGMIKKLLSPWSSGKEGKRQNAETARRVHLGEKST